MANEALGRRVTEEEYLAMLEASPVRLDFINGVVIDPWSLNNEGPQAMAGGSYEHGLIASNLPGALRSATDSRGCASVSADVSVRVGERREYCFPDVTVVCGEPSLDGAFLLNPAVVVEVLSPGTETLDRGPKFERYQALASIEEIVFVEQRRPRVERFRRYGAVWVYEWAESLSGQIEVLGTPVRLAEVYRGVRFPPPGPLDRA